MDPRAWRRFRKNKGALAGAVLVVGVLLFAVVGPFFSPYDPNDQHEDALRVEDGAPVGPNDKYVLGADTIGRDQLSRLLHGGRVSLQVGMFATALAVLLGMLIGVLSGYFGSWVDTVSMRSVDILLSMPFLLMAIAINRIIDSPELWVLYLLLGGLSWTTLARVTRSKTMQLRELEF